MENLSTKHAVLLFLITGVTCHQKSTMGIPIQCPATNGPSTECPNVPNKAVYFDAERYVVPSFWCPDRYHSLKMPETGQKVHACNPKSGPGKIIMDKYNSSEEPYKSFSEYLITCPRMYLEDGQYDIDNQGGLYNLKHKSYVSLGDYFINRKRAIVCVPRGTPASDTLVPLPAWCMSFGVPKDGYILKKDTLFVKEFQSDFELFTIEHDGGAHVCSELNRNLYETGACRKQGSVNGNHIVVLHNWNIRDAKPDPVFSDKEMFIRGEYYLDENMTEAVICADAEKHTGLPPTASISGEHVSASPLAAEKSTSAADIRTCSVASVIFAICAHLTRYPM